jgi:hypothetical protein
MKSTKQVHETIHSDIRAADIKECEGFEEINDELAEKIANAIKVYTEIIYNCFKEERFEEQNAKMISLSYEERSKAA